MLFHLADHGMAVVGEVGGNTVDVGLAAQAVRPVLVGGGIASDDAGNQAVLAVPSVGAAPRP